MSASTRARSRWRWAPLAAVAALLGVCGLAVAGTSGTATITTVAGTGVQGFSGDGGPATSAQLREPAALAVDAAGSLFIADAKNNRVRRVSPDGVITTAAGTGVEGFFGDGGQATSAQLKTPYGVAVDVAGNLYIADSGNQRVRRVSPAGVITTVAGTGVGGFSGDGGQATSAQLNAPTAVAVDAAGNVYVADAFNHRVRRVSPDGVITTVAGSGQKGFSGDGGQATSARLNTPFGVAVDRAGNLFIADAENHRVRRVSPDGVITTVAGTGVAGFSGDGGQATSAQLNRPFGVAVDSAGNLYITDPLNHRVRRVSPAGVITTVAGSGQEGFSGDGGQATSARLAVPAAVAVDAAGNLLISDQANQRVRKVVGLSPAGPAAPEAPGEGAAPVADAAVDAAVIGAVATRSRVGVRVVRVELEVGEQVSVRLALVRKAKTLASKRFPAVRPGSRVLTLPVPRRVTKGRATVRVELSDAAGNARVLKRGVAIPAAGRAA